MEEIRRLLAERGAADVEHPGGTLLEHLGRVQALLLAWDAPVAVQRAGLAHALYGTDGFATSLAALDERPAMATLLGPETEEIVYAYGSLDRSASYATIDRRIVDRFTGAIATPTPAMVSALVEITFANELDVLAHSVEVRERHGEALHALFTRWAHLASPAARAAAGV